MEAFSDVKFRINRLFRLITDVICSSVGVLVQPGGGGGVSLRWNMFWMVAQPVRKRHTNSRKGDTVFIVERIKKKAKQGKRNFWFSRRIAESFCGVASVTGGRRSANRNRRN